MKSINFSKMNFQGEDILSRLQMKKVKGGHVSCTQTIAAYCNNSGQAANHRFDCENGTLESCQYFHDADCLQDDCCDDVTCKNA